MFTEGHAENPITFFIPNTNLQPFDKNGLRSKSQNNSSRILQGLMYPITDLVLIKKFINNLNGLKINHTNNK